MFKKPGIGIWYRLTLLDFLSEFELGAPFPKSVLSFRPVNHRRREETMVKTWSSTTQSLRGQHMEEHH